MKPLLTILIAALPGQALAHVGHIGEVAGHAHWIGLAAAAGAIVIGAWIWGQKDDGAEPDVEEEAPEGEEQAT